MDNQKIKEALDSLSKTVCKEGMTAVTELVTAMGYTPSSIMEEGFYVVVAVGKMTRGKVFKVQDNIWSWVNSHEWSCVSTVMAIDHKNGAYLKLLNVDNFINK